MNCSTQIMVSKKQKQYKIIAKRRSKIIAKRRSKTCRIGLVETMFSKWQKDDTNYKW